MMKRREFIKQSAVASLSLSLVPSMYFRQHNAYVDKIGLQLYTVRNQMAKDPAGTLKAIKAAGYSQVEGGNPLEYGNMLPMIKDAGLYSQSSFINQAYITERWDLQGDNAPQSKSMDAVIEAAKKHNLKYLVFGYLTKAERESIDQYKQYAERLNQVGEQCEQAGIHLCYHNHSFEFQPINGQVPYEVLIKELDPKNVQFELDIFWASVGGHDPVKLMKKMKGQIRLLHLKNKKQGIADEYDEGQVPKDAFQEVGDGVIDIIKVLKLAPKAGVEQCFVEQDQSPDPIESIAQSTAYLKMIESKI
ncbi:sugar phosphate isomerase/epimerase family protein [Catalinimonas niigatensis]|uniref:sugar phosphate isomerase/epimerase family protein n=1 Tax=Catalinimonas niigatensis TaxID=1397264 RepID=UPI0026662093|nr:sugar phosphate isomerase/epimerase [Catalinimonas niigatensis]WPP50158.1 sugar phosphate isomerase/epimerase [Catalinimonas niigatensis]